jgi:hypothetical protein
VKYCEDGSRAVADNDSEREADTEIVVVVVDVTVEKPQAGQIVGVIDCGSNRSAW